MKNSLKTYILSIAACAAAVCFVSCSENRQGWSLSGNIAGAADTTLFIEEPSGAAWIIIDSLTTDSDGDFTYRAVHPLTSGQAIYRLRMGDRAVYFPVENSESLTLTASANNMESVHTLSGSVAASGFNTIDSLVAESVARLGVAGTLNDPALFDKIGNIILADSTCIVSYYAIMRPVADKPLFTFNNSKKLGLLGAAATRYASLRPGDVRGQELAALHVNARKALRGDAGTGQTLAAELTGRPTLDFVRKDIHGVDHDLNVVLDRGGVTVLNLTRYDHSLSPATTATLGQIYEKYKDRGLVIYQVDFEPNEAHWRQNASTMPWITVYNRPEDDAEILIKYNANPVEGAPVSFVFNSQGEVKARVSDPEELEKAVAAQF